MRIVIVEDEKILLKILEEKFREEKFEVFSAMDGEEALVVIKDASPDIIVLDIILPKKDGFKVLEELKLDVKLKQIPVMVLSNLGQEEEINKALSLGAAGYLVKTQYPIKEVVEKVKDQIAKRGQTISMGPTLILPDQI